MYGSVPWYHRAAAGCILALCAAYTIAIGFILGTRCTTDGPECSYLPVGHIEDSSPPQMAVFALTPSPPPDSHHLGMIQSPQTNTPTGARSATTTLELRQTSGGTSVDDVEENKESSNDGNKPSCIAYLRSKKGTWHGGRAEDRAEKFHNRMVESIGQWLESMKSSPAADVVVGDLVPQVSGELSPAGPPSGLALSVSKLEDAYNRLLQRPTYFAGNTVTWYTLVQGI